MAQPIPIEKAIGRSEPRLWIRRLVILPSPSPGVDAIRDLTFTKGLNVVWAKEPDKYDPLIGISGHSAGKTSFCRLVRYLFGEPTFATAENEVIIASEFPEGYIGAEIRVFGKSWGVLRPLGSGRLSYAGENETLEDLVDNKGKPLSHAEYLGRIGFESFVSSFPIRTIPQTGEAIHWGHLLAWITRDQENRFRNLHDWRSPTSESRAPEFRFRKEGPLFLLRGALGIVEPAEVGVIQAAEETEKSLARTKQQIADRQRDSERLVAHYRQQVDDAAALYADETDESSGPLFDQPELRAEEALKGFESQMAQLQNELGEVQKALDEVGAEIVDVERSKVQMEARRGHGTSAVEEVASSADRQSLSFRENQICPFGQIFVRDCDYYQRTNEVLASLELSDAREREQAEARRAQVLDQIATEVANFESRLLLLRSKRLELMNTRSELDNGMEILRIRSREVRFALEGHRRWTREVLEKVPHDVQTLWEHVAKDERRLKDLALEHQALVRSVAHSLEQFGSVFAALVTFLLGGNGYRGSVRCEKGNLSFEVTEKGSLSGEAVRTLVVLLSDIACLVFGSANDRPSLPGFLLHDSPRDADLGAGLYERLFLLAMELTDQLGGTENCCFQYIVTTTTAPPPEILDRDMVRLRLNASDSTELLFRRRFTDLGGLFVSSTVQ